MKQVVYQMRADSGVVVDATAKTLTGAKREASKWMAFGGGSVYVVADGKDVCVRKFWQNGNHFGWDAWKTVD